MSRRLLLLLAAAVAFCVPVLPSLRASTSLMTIDEVKTGMRGKGVTVFAGATRSEFDVEILGVLANVVGPRRSLILARLSGQRLAETGVMQGMSGSPVYVDGRLIGAVSYSLGSFSKEPIAGITPIAEMIDATTSSAAARPSAVRASPVAMRWPPTRDDFVAALRETFARLRPGGSAPGGESRRVGPAGVRPRAGGREARSQLPRPSPCRASRATPRRRSPPCSAASGLRPPRPRQRANATASCRTTGARRCRRRQSDQRRSRVRRHGHGDARGRVTGLRLRSSLLQSRSNRVPDDQGVGADAAAEPVRVGQARGDRRHHRHGPAGSRDGDRRHDRTRARSGARYADALARARAGPHLPLRHREGPALHAAPHLRLDREHAAVVRARVRRRDLHRARQGGGARPRHGRARGHLHRRHAGDRRRRLRRRPDQPAAAQRSPAGADRSRRSRHPVVRGAPHRDDRARLAGHARAPRRLDRPGAHPHAQLPRRRADRHAAAADSGACARHGVDRRLGRQPAGADRAARPPPAAPGRQRGADDPRVQPRAPQQPAVREARRAGVGRRGQGRAAAGAAAVGARRHRRRPAAAATCCRSPTRCSASGSCRPIRPSAVSARWPCRSASADPRLPPMSGCSRDRRRAKSSSAYALSR